MATTYTTRGTLTSTCGHRHRTIGTAEDCRAANNRAVKRHYGQSSYSDRVIVAVEDGEARVLDDYERETLDEHLYARMAQGR